ncbi:MAG: ERAP1-like C-terminal domain-containing protein [Firmicutes bacterium]|nr:ERAP1-like C-terminal domain-containing protein [Bacillota bacterium]MCL5013568.1 ERAP1-like C-terminal domain-containing protein [Bacillota bacterium]
MTEAETYRLPRNVRPSLYRLEIAPDLSAGKFHGHEAVDIEVLDNTDTLVLNAHDLTVYNIVATQDDHESLNGNVLYNAEEEQITLNFEQPLVSGKWRLFMDFDGLLADDLRGFYRTTIDTDGGDPLVFACTQCEATDARRVFPCWDEPDFKARFAITLSVDPDLTALSNEKILSESIDAQGKRQVQFAETIPMSTYLVALIVGPLDMTSEEVTGNVPIRIAARPKLLHLANFAKREAVKSLEYFRNYFGIDYPGSKLDHVAIPDFAAGAMENLGCVTYREESLLIDEKHSSPVEQMQVVMTIAHETAHMWFGDMVTMQWWNGLWLNEAFATFMELLAMDALHPEWDIWTGFGVQRTYAFAIDGLVATRPIEFPVKRPVEAEAMFDVLTYDKGASVLRMLEQYLEPEVFQQGITRYLQTHQYQNAETSDLWASLAEVSGQPIGEIMDSWVFQPGYPLIRAQWHQSHNQLMLSQKRFQYQDHEEGQWKIPVSIGMQMADNSHQTLSVLLDRESLSIPVPPGIRWIRVNQGGWGFYRVAYDTPLWSGLIASIGEMTALERLTIFDDVWAAALTDDVPLSHVTELWKTLVREQDPDVWGIAMQNIALLDAMGDERDREVLRNFVKRIATPPLQRLGWDSAGNDSVKTARLRARLILSLGTIGRDQGVCQEAHDRLMAHIEGREPAAPELLNSLIGIVAENGTDQEWDIFYEQFKKSSTPQETVRYLYALAQFPQDRLVKRAFALYLSDEVRIQDGIHAMGGTLRHQKAQHAAWDFIEEHWNDITAKFPPYMLYPLIVPVSWIVTDELAERTAQWFKTHPVPPAERFIAQSIEFQNVHRTFAHRVRGHIANALK